MSNELSIPTDKKSLGVLQERLTTLSKNYSAADDASIQFITRDKSGEYAMGLDKLPITKNDKWVVDIINSEQGYRAWGDEGGAPMGDEMRPITDLLVNKADLPVIMYSHPKYNQEVEAQWDLSYSLRLICVEGEYVGAKAQYNISSKSGTREVTAIFAAVSVRLNDKKGQFLPVIILSGEEYTHKKWGVIKAIKLPTVAWLSIDEVNAKLNSAPDETDAPLSTPRAA